MDLKPVRTDKHLEIRAEDDDPADLHVTVAAAPAQGVGVVVELGRADLAVVIEALRQVSREVWGG